MRTKLAYCVWIWLLVLTLWQLGAGVANSQQACCTVDECVSRFGMEFPR